jgi:hypothetical protein
MSKAKKEKGMGDNSGGRGGRGRGRGARGAKGGARESVEGPLRDEPEIFSVRRSLYDFLLWELN